MTVDKKIETDAEKLIRRNRELSILNIIAQALNRSVDLDQALRAALANVAELLDLQTGWIWLLDEKTGESYLAAAQNLPPALAQNPRRMEGSCHCLDTYRAGDLDGAANVNVITCSRLWGLVDGTDGLRYHASIPLYAHGKELGVLNVASTDWRELTDDDLRLLHTVGDLLSIAVERARLFARSSEFGAVEERNRLAREIHDTLAQGLAGIALQLETADALLASRGESTDLRRALEKAIRLTRENLEEARRSVMDLRAAPLEGSTLSQALEALAEEFREKYQLNVTFESSGGARPMPVRIEAGLYRIAQEALTNVAQHAHAEKAYLKLLIFPEKAQLFVIDDGDGFEPQAMPADRFGLVGLNERAKLMGGKLNIHSEPGTGTEVSVEIDLV